MFKIGNVELGSHCKPFIIAELSANHNGSLDKAKQLIAAAASAGGAAGGASGGARAVHME